MIGKVLAKRLKLQGMIVTYHEASRSTFETCVSAYIREQRLHYREAVVEGLENVPSAFIDLLEGLNFGKLLVNVPEALLVRPEHWIPDEQGIC